MSPPARAWLLDRGEWTPAAALPVTDRAVRYGMSVFETLGVRGGVPLLTREHLALLRESARELMGRPMPHIPPLPSLEGGGVLRIYLTAGDGAPCAPVTAPRVFAIFEEASGRGLASPQSARVHPSPVVPFGGGRKTGNYWMNCAAQAAAVADGFDHALLAGHDGRLLSASFGNVFFVLDGALCTPSASLAVRRGVIRSHILRSEPVREVEFPAVRLGEVSEVFLTNSRLGAMPLRVGTVAPGPVGKRWRETLQRENLVP